MSFQNLISKFTNFFNTDDENSQEDSIFVIDIGSHSIKVLTGRCENKSIIIDNYNKILSPQSMSKISYFDDISSDISSISNKIELLLEDFSAYSNYLVISLPDNFSIIKMLALDKLPNESELENLIKKQIEGSLPHPYEEWEFTTDVVDKTDETINMIILATLKINIKHIIKIVTNLLAEPDYITCSSFLAHEILYPYLENNPNNNIALINMGNVTTSVSIFKGTHFRFMQNIGIGGYNFTLDIANAIQCSITEAENYKKNEVFFLPEYAPQQEKIKNYLIIKPTFMELARGIFYFFESYFTKYFEEKIDEIIIYGGGANFKNIDVILNGMLNIPVKKASSIVKIKNNQNNDLDEETINTFFPAIGAVFGSYDELKTKQGENEI